MTALDTTPVHQLPAVADRNAVWRQLLEEVTADLHRLRNLALSGEEFDSREYNLVVLQYNAFLRRTGGVRTASSPVPVATVPTDAPMPFAA